MTTHNLICSQCSTPFFTDAEKTFYERRRLNIPRLCKACRDEKKETTRNTLREIVTNWNIEAKYEITDYFYNINEADELMRGTKHFVIGRKGSGKTAIGNYLCSHSTFDNFSERLSFKNFPFNYLYSLENDKYTAPNQFITIWKYLIYSSICKMMVRNESIDASIRNNLKEIYPDDSTKMLPRMVEDWTATGFGLEFFGVGVSGSKENKPPLELSWIEKTNILEDVVINHLDSAKYVIVFDELDEDYREFESSDDRRTYLHLLTSLFKATQDVRALAKNNGLSILPIVFLRTDIYSLIKDSDRNKWNSFKIDLDWSIDKIKRMLAHRISVASSTPDLTFDHAWNMIFHNQQVIMGHKQKGTMSIFDFITRSTHLRPRDYIHYLIECAQAALNESTSKIRHLTVKIVDDKFSEYLKGEIIDEAHPVMPDISVILEILSQIRKQTFQTADFVKIYGEYLESNRIAFNQGAQNVLMMLFEFSVIGNIKNIHSNAIFKYQTVSARFNHKENVMIHRGLYKALQIY